MVSVVVTGANRGIGLGLVKEFLKGNNVSVLFATTRNVQASKDLTAIQDSRVRVIEMDLDSDESIKGAVKKIDATLGAKGLDLLVNNSGVLLPVDLNGPLDRKAVSANMEVNAVGTLIVTQAFLPLLRKASSTQGQSRVVNISSFLGSIASSAGSTPRNFLAYNMSKAAVNMLTKTLSVDLKEDKIYVTSFCPGWVQTDMGGKEAMLTVEQTASHLVNSIKKLGPEHSGGFYQNTLEPIPY